MEFLKSYKHALILGAIVVFTLLAVVFSARADEGSNERDFCWQPWVKCEQHKKK